MAFEENELLADLGRVQVNPQDSLGDAIREVITDLSKMDREYRSFTNADFRVLARGLQLTLNVLSASMGECQVNVPFSPLRPVIHPDGTLRWCCNHNPEHCA